MRASSDVMPCVTRSWWIYTVFMLRVSHEFSARSGRIQTAGKQNLLFCCGDWQFFARDVKGVTLRNLWTAQHSNRNKRFQNELCDTCFWGFSFLFTACCLLVGGTARRRPFNFTQFMHRSTSHSSYLAVLPSSSECTLCHCLMLCFRDGSYAILLAPVLPESYTFCHFHNTRLPATRYEPQAYPLLSTQQNNKCG